MIPVLIKADSQVYSSALIQQCMSSWYQQYQMIWDERQFEENWAECDNYEIFIQQQRVGICRLYYDQKYCYLRDLHIETEYRNQGIGEQVLGLISNLCLGKGLDALRLRVFLDNPASRLYLRYGFMPLKADHSTRYMEYQIR
ncbi:GNAT family N-acetyltransferase [Oceanospirillum sediminis]|uniref:GNAT family N-acetyltransferase n=1 Tax=Oceanospirillum sediminis TaxID=2760088 RepID=A0A839IP58_9GAMM|nr:GNAT family N-acetyltransferase [Oceanospirillum sediminis]MBB1486247.1 GNAT family N-acetyltransferase [Oceanospirillum sediminis]